MAFRLLAVILPLLAVGCAHENDAQESEPSESAEAFARRAFADMDAAGTCAELEAAWDQYVDATTRAAIRRLVPCTNKVVSAEHPVVGVQEFDGEVHVELDGPVIDDSTSFTYDTFLNSGWVVVTGDADRRLRNATLDYLDECLQTQDECRIAG